MALKGRQQTIREVQQEFALNSGFQRHIIWDLLIADQDNLLKTKLKELLPDPTPKDKRKLQAIQERRAVIFERIWAQRKYTNGNLLTAIIYVAVTKEMDLNEASNSTQFSLHPVFRARKCYNEEGDGENCCMLFIDETGRVYQNWTDFIENNIFPEGCMVLPKHGIYRFDNREHVELEIRYTPASSWSSRIIAAADTSSAVGGFVFSGISIAKICSAPISAPIIAFARGVGVVVISYSMLRSLVSIIDRTNQEQSISLADRQARNSWLGMAAGIVGLGASRATRTLTATAAAGRNVSLVTEIVVNGMNISSIILTGASTFNGVFDLILKRRNNEDWTLAEVAQLSASLFLFTHSVYNFRLASRIANETRAGTIEGFSRALSNRQRRMFDKLSKETIRIQGASRGKMDIIRSVNEIPSKQFLNDLFKINGDLNKHNIRPSFADGGIVLNGEIPVKTPELRANVQHGIGPDILGQVKQPIPPSNKNVNIKNGDKRFQLNRFNAINLNEEINANIFEKSKLSAGVRALIACSIDFPCGRQIKLADLGSHIFERISNAESFRNVISVLASIFSIESFKYCMSMIRRFIEQSLDEIEKIIKVFISSENVLYRFLMHFKRAGAKRTIEYLNAMKQEIAEEMHDFFMSFNSCRNANERTLCARCNNFFSIFLDSYKKNYRRSFRKLSKL